MGKASRWFRGLLGLKTSAASSQGQVQKQSSRKKWSFAKSREEKAGLLQGPRNDVVNEDDESKHGIPVAAATAEVAEAAVAEKQATAAVVLLKSSWKNISLPAEIAGDVGATATAVRVFRSEVSYRSREERAAVTIQSHFRAYLSRRALRALKALVRLQALVRGHLVRKQTTYVLRRLQALVRAQVRAQAGRVVSESSHSSAKSLHFKCPGPGPATPEKFEHAFQVRNLKREQMSMLQRNLSTSSRCTNHDPEKSHASHICRNSMRGEESWEHRSFTRPVTADDYEADEVLEVDSGKPPIAPIHRNLLYSSHLTRGTDPNCPSFSISKDSTAHRSVRSQCGKAQSLSCLLNFAHDDESSYCTAGNSPTFYSASSMGSSKRGAFTPTNSDCSWSCISGYSDHPNYMAYTESSKAKVRSLSAPKLRLQFERSSSMKKHFVQTYGDPRFNQIGSLLHANFTNKAYPESGRLDKLGIHAKSDIAQICGANWH